ncbi:MAG TPA: 3-hydroxyacyl-[acyl-carrier-protein] dehydratase FabZ [Peptococcaceae bacterium]|nr:MAG: 3-hydroxyacyl-[acyl-carrier-protein] dehydratase FabZ [Clostridia bacterium 41_269]HBT20888.1 3-hydroxyacyl-[acyl-carrier-protein] dehydratase FabZ [Peptococcaceae bacterium]
MINADEIMKIIPHRYPFLLVDKVVELDVGKRVVGIKNVSINEPFFQGHFPGRPVMPGVLIIEAMAQVGAVGILKMPEFQGKLALFAGIDKARFRRQVIPGDQLRIEVEVLKLKGQVGKCDAKAYVDNELVCEAQLMFAVEK